MRVIDISRQKSHRQLYSLEEELKKNNDDDKQVIHFRMLTKSPFLSKKMEQFYKLERTPIKGTPKKKYRLDPKITPLPFLLNDNTNSPKGSATKRKKQRKRGMTLI